jgi:hypothetical protein
LLLGFAAGMLLVFGTGQAEEAEEASQVRCARGLSVRTRQQRRQQRWWLRTQR